MRLPSEDAQGTEGSVPEPGCAWPAHPAWSAQSRWAGSGQDGVMPGCLERERASNRRDKAEFCRPSSLYPLLGCRPPPEQVRSPGRKAPPPPSHEGACSRRGTPQRPER